MLFMGKGDGTFELKPTAFSGLDASGICGQVADLNNDGLLDILFAADPDNSGLSSGLERYEDKAYWNTGLHGARGNHWLRLRFSGVSDAELIGARVEVRDLFSATPARLKFLKSERAETMAVTDVVRRLAMAHPEIGFTLQTGE